MHETDGLVLRYAYQSGGNPQPAIELIAAFGGVNGQRGVRDGDIGTERVPISQWFQLAPEFCRDNTFALERNTFELRSSVAHIAGVLPRDATLTLGDARNWSDAKALLTPASAAAEPILVARMPLVTGKVSYLALQRVAGAASATELDTYRDVSATPGAAPPPEQFAARYAVDQLPKVFARTREHFRVLRERVSVSTPDPFVDAAVGALNVAADALWDEPQQVLMHGAIAWRARLLGWRGPYVMDALGWHDRARRHLEYWATRQNTVAGAGRAAARGRSDASRTESRRTAQQRRHLQQSLRHEPGLHRCAVPASAVDRRSAIRARSVADDRTSPGLGAPAVSPRVRPAEVAAVRGVRGDLGQRRSAVPRRRRHARLGLQLVAQRDGGAHREVVRRGCRALRTRGRGDQAGDDGIPVAAGAGHVCRVSRLPRPATCAPSRGSVEFLSRARRARPRKSQPRRCT